MLALPLVLGGCTSDDGKKPTVLPSLAPPAVSPSAVPVPSVPPEASAETAQGAAAFARHYMDVLSQSLQAADPEPVVALSDAGCGGCQNLIGAIREERKQNQRINGAAFRVIFAEAPPVQAGEVVLDLRYERLSGQLVEAGTGRVIEDIRPEPAIDAQMRLRKSPTGWAVLGLRSVK